MQSPPAKNQASELAGTLEELNARIARLSKFLDADIGNDEALDGIFERKIAPLQQSAAAKQFRAFESVDRRRHNDWEEQRGLLILRCEIMTKLIDEFGIDTAKELAEVAEAALIAHGFMPGADGLRLFRRYPYTTQ